MPRVVAADVVCHSPLVGHELLPADVTRVSGFQANCPIRDCYLDGSPNRTAAALARVLLPTAINIGPSIGWILKNAANACTVGVAPDHIVW